MAVPVLTSMVMVVAEEPHDSDEGSTNKEEKHLEPLELSLVELIDNNFAACDIDEGATRCGHEDGVKELVACSYSHSDKDADGREGSEKDNEDDAHLCAVTGTSESASNGNSSGTLVD